MKTKIKNASVKVMLSYDYSHFETLMSLENEDGLTTEEIDEARKKCQRLSDKAVGQYRKAKDMASLRIDGEIKIRNFTEECERIRAKKEGDRTINEAAMLKQFEDEEWEDKFMYAYDYDDDDEYDI